MAGIGSHHDTYVAASLEEKRRWVTSGPGAAATQLAIEGLGSMAQDFAKHAETMRGGLQHLGVAWAGEAASNATARLQAAASWAEQTGQVGTTGKGSVDNYTQSFTTTVAQVPEPHPVPDLGFWDQPVWDGPKWFFDIQTDHDRAMRANQEADAAAVRALDQHEAATRLAAATFPDDDDLQPGTGPAARADVPGHPAPGQGLAASRVDAGGIGIQPDTAANGRASSADPGTDHSHAGPPVTNPVGVTPIAPPNGPGASPPLAWPPPDRGGTGAVGPIVAPPLGGGYPSPGAQSRTESRPGRGTDRLGPAPSRGSTGSSQLPPLTRGGTNPPAWIPLEGSASGPRAGVLPGAGLPPMMGGGLGAGGPERQRRKQSTVRDDEPFAVPLDDDVTPAVLGVDDPEDPEDAS